MESDGGGGGGGGIVVVVVVVVRRVGFGGRRALVDMAGEERRISTLVTGLVSLRVLSWDLGPWCREFSTRFP